MSVQRKFKKSLKRYFGARFRSDLVAGLTVAMIVIPQSMAYASIAGMSPIYGLFTAIVPTIIAALFGSFPYLITGPTNPAALVTASVLVAYINEPNYAEFVFALAIIAGLFNIIFGIIKLGTLTRYISNSVLVGFLTAVGVLIITSQLGNLLGIELLREGGLFGILTQLVQGVSEFNFFAIIVSGTSITIMLLIRKINRKLPAALIAIISASLLTIITGWSDQQGVQLVELPDKLGFGFHVPNISLREFASLGVSGAAMALLGFMETISIAKSMSQMTGEPVNPSQEMLGQGLASFVGGFFQCLPSAGSPSRTVINVVNGAKTKFSAIISGIAVLTFLLLFSGLLGYIPVAALAAIVIVSAAGLVNVNIIKVTWQSRLNSRVVMVLTFVSTLVLPLEYAIYLGILSTILIYLGESSHMNLSYIIENGDGQYIELPIEGIEKRSPEIAIINIEGDLYFAAADDLQKQIERILETDLKVLILRFRRTHLLASTGIMALDQLLKSARDKGLEILFCGLQEETLRPLETAGVTSMIGESKIFTAKDQLFDSTQRALTKARAILKEKTKSEEKITKEVEEIKEENNPSENQSK